MIDLLSLIPLLQTAPAVSSDLSAPVGEDFSALLNELVAPAEQSDLQPADPIALLDHTTPGFVESAGTKPREKENLLSPAHLLLPTLPSAGPFFESPIPSPDLALGLQPAIPQVKAAEDFTRAVLNDLKKFELTVHYEIAGAVQSVSKQAFVTSDPIANIQQPQVFARFVEPQQPSAVTPGPQLIQNAVAGLLREPSVSVTATNGQESLSAVEVAPTVREEEPVRAILVSPPAALAAATLPSGRVFTDFNEVQLVEPVRTLSAIAQEQTEPPAAPLITTDPIVRLALPRSSAPVFPMLQTTGDGKAQLKATAPAPTNGLMLQRTSEPEPVQPVQPVQAGVVPVRSFVLDLAGVDLSQFPSQDSPRSMPKDVRDVKELEVKPPVTTLLPGEELILETTEEAALTVVSTESDLEELPLLRGILTAKALVNAKQSDPDKAGSGGPKFSDSGASAPVAHFETRSRSVDAVEQPRQAHWVEIPHMPKLQVVRTVSMELGDAGSEVAVRIQERDGGMTLHFGTGNDSLQSTIESSVGVLVHALKQEQIQLSNVEVTRKAPIDKVRRMKEAHNGHR